MPFTNDVGDNGLPAPAPNTTAGAGQTQAGAPPAPDQTITIGARAGYTPDYNSLIQGDPGYLAAQNTVTGQDAQAADQRRAALRQMAVQYGGLPSNFSDQYGDIDQATLDAAKGNQYSTLAQLQRNYQNSVDQFRKALAARGALQSGDLSYGQDQLDTGYGQNEYDAGNAFLNNENGALNSYLGVVSGGRQTLANAISTAEANQEANPNNNPDPGSPGQVAKLDAKATDLYGQPIYTLDDGQGNVTQYDVNGNTFDPVKWYADLTSYKPGQDGLPTGPTRGGSQI